MAAKANAVAAPAVVDIANELRLTSDSFHLHIVAKWSPTNQSRAIRNLLISAAIAKINNNNKEDLSQESVLKTYTDCVHKFQSLAHKFGFCTNLMTNRTKKVCCTGKSLLRIYRNQIRTPLIACAKHVMLYERETIMTSDEPTRAKRLVEEGIRWWLALQKKMLKQHAPTHPTTRIYFLICFRGFAQVSAKA